MIGLRGLFWVKGIQQKAQELRTVKYILDTNEFITAELEWYKQAFHLGGFWKYLEEGILSGHIVLCDAVYDELMKKDDVINKWLSSRDFNPTACKNEPQIIGKPPSSFLRFYNSGVWGYVPRV